MFYFPHFWKVGSPSSRHQQIWCLMRNHLFTDKPLLTVTFHGRRSPGSLSHFFYKDTNPIQKSSTFKISSHSIIVTSKRLHLRILKQWRKVRISTDESGLRRHVDRNIQSIADGFQHNQWSKKEQHMKLRKKGFKLTWEFCIGEYKSQIYPGKFLSGLKCQIRKLRFTTSNAEKLKKSTSDKLSIEVRMLSFMLPQTSWVNFLM